MNLCRNCDHYFDELVSSDPCPAWDDKCSRKATKSIDPIYGSRWISGKLLDCGKKIRIEAKG